MTLSKNIALLTVVDMYSVEHRYDPDKIIDSEHVIGINPNFVVSIEAFDCLENSDCLCSIRTSDGVKFYARGTVSDLALCLGFAPDTAEKDLR